MPDFKSSDQAIAIYNLRIKARLDGKYCLVLSSDKPAYALSMDKKGQFHIIAHNKEWEYRMLHEGAIQNYLNSLLDCLHAYKFEVEKLENQRYLLTFAFSKKEKPTI